MAQSPAFGPTIWIECAAAGISAGVVQMFVPVDVLNPDGSVLYPAGTVLYAPGATADQRAAVQKVVAAHDPTKKLPRAVEVSDLLDALSAAQRASITPDHMQRLQARGAKGPVTAADPKVVRAASDLGLTPDAWVAMVPGGP